MRTKERHLFSKVIAVICVLTLCVTMLTPATYAVVSMAEKIVIHLQEGSTYYDSDSDLSMIENLDDYADLDTGFYDSETYRYKRGDAKNTIEVYPLEGENFGKSITYYVDADTRPVITATGLPKAPTITQSKVNGYWKVVVNIGTATATTVELLTQAPTPEYTVTFPADTDDYTILEGTTGSYLQGASVDIKVKLHDKLTKTLVIRVDGEPQETTLEGDDIYCYTIKNLNSNKKVTVSADVKTFTVDGPNASSAYTYRPVGSNRVNYDQSFSFYVIPAEGQKTPTVSVRDNVDGSSPEELQPVSSNLYVCSNITANKIIEVQAKGAESYNVHFTQGTGYKITGLMDEELFDQSVQHNGGVTFNVTPDAGYKISRVAANNQTIEKTGDVYKLENVKSDTTISASAQELIHTFQYNYTEADNGKKFKLTQGKAIAKYDEAYTFYVEAIEGFETPSVSSNFGKVSKIGESQYIINITGDDFASKEQKVVISITAGDPSQQTVTFNKGTGYTFTYENGTELEKLMQSITYNGEFKFKVALDGDYTQSQSDIVVTVNGVNLSPVDDVYIISNITENKVISVSGVQKNTYTVTLQQGTGYVLSTTENTKVTAGGTFTFSLNINPGYTGVPVVKAGNAIVPRNEDGYYRFTVTDDTTVTVDDITPASYGVKKEAPNAQVIPEGNTPISYGGSYKFKVEADPYYQVDQVAINGVVATAVNGVYTINNIIDNNNEITVVTSPIELTVHYVDGKYNLPLADSTYTIESANKILPELSAPEGSIYTFAGWVDAQNESVDQIVENQLVTGGEIILTAKWELDTKSIGNAIKLDTTGSWTENDQYYQLTFNTVVALIDQLSEEYQANVRLTGYGTLYSGQAITNPDESVIKAILERSDDVNPDALIRDTIEAGRLYNYFSNIDLASSDLTGEDTFKLILKASQKGDRYGLGWIELTVDGKKIIVCGKCVCASANETNVPTTSN